MTVERSAPRPPLLCRLGLHEWRQARDENERPCFCCYRCGVSDAESESLMQHARWFFWGGWQPPSRLQ